MAAIIVWEMAGFSPASFEISYKDLVLGSSNLYFSWYRAFKNQTVRFLPAAPLRDAHERLMELLHLIIRAREREEDDAVGAFIQKRWIGREKLVMGGSVVEG